MNNILISFTALPEFLNVIAERKEQVSISTAIENVEVVHECGPQHLRMVKVVH